MKEYVERDVWEEEAKGGIEKLGMYCTRCLAGLSGW